MMASSCKYGIFIAFHSLIKLFANDASDILKQKRIHWTAHNTWSSSLHLAIVNVPVIYRCLIDVTKTLSPATQYISHSRAVPHKIYHHRLFKIVSLAALKISQQDFKRSFSMCQLKVSEIFVCKLLMKIREKFSTV